MFDLFQGYQIHVYTDSPEHVLKEFPHRKFNLIQASSELQEFTLLSQYENMVCSNSSFSWWASQLGVEKQRIMVPDKWLLTNDSKELYLPNMTLVET